MSWDGGSIAAAAFLAGLWFCTALCQIPLAPSKWILRRDRIGLFPSWWLFSPTPIASDLGLFFRDRLEDGSLTDWRVVIAARPRRLTHALWNPWERRNRIVQGIRRDLEELLWENEPAQVQLSGVYIQLLARVANEPAATAAVARQFVLLRSFGPASPRLPEPVFLSSFHALESRGQHS